MRRLVLVCAVAALAISPAFGQSRRGGSSSNDRDGSGISGFDVPNFNRTGGNAAPRAPIPTPPRVPPVSPSGVTSAASSAGRGGARAIAAVVAGGAVAAGAAGAAAARRRQSNP